MSNIRVPLPEWFGDIPFFHLDEAVIPTDVWGMFEYLHESGEVTWCERATHNFDIHRVYSAVSTYLDSLEREGVGDRGQINAVAALSESDEHATSRSPIDSRYGTLSFLGLDHGRLTGRFVFLSIGYAAEDTAREDLLLDFFSPGLNEFEARGVLRLAELRFLNSLSWDTSKEPEPEPSDTTDVTERISFSEIFESWQFPMLRTGVAVEGVWAIIESSTGLLSVEDEEWHIRSSGDINVDRVFSVLSQRIDSLEESLVEEWEPPDDEDADEGSTDDEPDGTEQDGTEPDEDEDDFIFAGSYPTARDAPLDPRIGGFTCDALPTGTYATRALLLALCRTDGGTVATYRAYAAAPGSGHEKPFISDFLELGLLRAGARDLRENELD